MLKPPSIIDGELNTYSMEHIFKALTDLTSCKSVEYFCSPSLNEFKRTQLLRSQRNFSKFSMTSSFSQTYNLSFEKIHVNCLLRSGTQNLDTANEQRKIVLLILEERRKRWGMYMMYSGKLHHRDTQMAYNEPHTADGQREKKKRRASILCVTEHHTHKDR